VDLNTICEVARPKTGDAAIDWRDGDAWLAGGTWLFSEPQPKLARLIDLGGLGWPAFEVNSDGLRLGGSGETHHLAPTGAGLQMPMTRFSIAA